MLVVAAHPDDETLGCGATIRRLADNDHNIMLITLTDGVGARNNENDENRNNRLEDVCRHLGINEWVSGNFPDNKMDSVPLLDIVQFIEKQLKQANFKPRMVFTHHPHCLNVDHSLAYRATLTALRPLEGNMIQIYSFMIPSSTDYNPLAEFRGNTYFKVTSNQAQMKVDILSRIYGDEMRRYPHTRSCRNVLNLMRVWGSEIGNEYAEKFQLIRDVR